MASISQRRDLDDAAVIRNVARQIETVETLNLLTLLTFADSQGTSDKLWNGFKDSLLWDLHRRAASLLSGGTEFIRAEEKRREMIMQDVRELSPELSEDELRAHFSMMPLRYFQIHTAMEILGDIQLAHRFMRQQVLEDENAWVPVIAWQDEPDRGCNLVRVCTWDRAGLFGKIAGSLSACGLNILSAQIFTRTDNIVLDTFFVNDAKTGNLATREQHAKFGNLLDKVLTGDVDLAALIKRQIAQPLYQAYAGERIPTQISFDNEASETRTLIEIETEDHVGLLYTISQTLAELALDISGARIVTERGAAIDSFYVRELDGGKIESPARQISIENNLRQAIRSLEIAA
jgi:[protein-PII] uridylyltransferase